MNVEDFVNFNLSDREAEERRLTLLISNLTECSKETRVQLADGFLAIVVDGDEALGRRIQAASMLGYQARRLGIKGASSIANSLANVLQQELLCFGSARLGHRVAGAPSVSGPEILFLKRLVYAVLVIDVTSGQEMVDSLARLLAGSEIASWATALAEKAKQANDRGGIF